MTDVTASKAPAFKRAGADAARVKARYAAEKRFQFYGIVAITIAMMALTTLLYNIISQGMTAFIATEIQLTITFDAADIDPGGTGDVEKMRWGDYPALVRKSLMDRFPEIKTLRGSKGRRAVRKLTGIVSDGAAERLQQMVLADPNILGRTRDVWVLASDDIDMLAKGYIDRNVKESKRRVKNQELVWFDSFAKEGRVRKVFNMGFLLSGSSQEPELAGIRGALVGTLLTMIVTLLLSFPIGVMTAVYLEEFAPVNRWTDLIEVNINNLAAVPSIVFGLLGLAVFLNVFNLPRSAPVVGGLVLSLMTLPTIIIAARASLKAVPPSIREAAIGLGASPLQVVMHHVLPLAMPGILTGTIIGMAQALGETAPLLMIGMVAFVADIPQGFTDPATVLPVQIFLWAGSPERAFLEKTSGAIMVLLVFLVAMNAFAVFLRKKFERRW